MDVGRLCGVLGAEDHATHQRIAEYVKTLCEQYRAMGFTPRDEWVMEQTIRGLRLLLADLQVSDPGRRAVEAFLAIASEELPGPP